MAQYTLGMRCDVALLTTVSQARQRSTGVAPPRLNYAFVIAE
jgi:hypothetical protein